MFHVFIAGIKAIKLLIILLYYRLHLIIFPVIFHSFSISGAAGYDVCFVHPRSAGGILLELVQAPDDVIAALSKK